MNTARSTSFASPAPHAPDGGRTCASSRRCTLRLPPGLARRLDAWCAGHPHIPRAALLLRLLETGLRQSQARPAHSEHSALSTHSARSAPPAPSFPSASPTPLPHRRLRAQAAVYLPASPYAELHGLRPGHHLALERSLDAALEGEPGEAAGRPAAGLGRPDYRLDEE